MRYRYDEQKQKRYKTVELIIDERDWKKGSRSDFLTTLARYERVGTVLVEIGLSDRGRRQKSIEAGAEWDPHRKAWKMDYDTAIEPGFETRITKFTESWED